MWESTAAAAAAAAKTTIMATETMLFRALTIKMQSSLHTQQFLFRL